MAKFKGQKNKRNKTNRLLKVYRIYTGINLLELILHTVLITKPMMHIKEYLKGKKRKRTLVLSIP